MKENMKQSEKLKKAGIEPISERELERQYSDMFDEVYGEVMIAGYEYSTSYALLKVDPTAFDVGFSDWLSTECEDRLIEIDGDYYERDVVYGFELSEEE